ncbi:MAG: hypothetical protein IKJ94_06230 [Oscillospiraceae bacterium]|nr:hypothetical protein [Oscillospiraceae bacterium]
MYYATKRLTTVSALLGAVNAFVTAMYFLSYNTSSMSPTMKITVAFLLITATLTSLILTIALRKLCDALELNFENDAENMREIRQKIEKLEENAEITHKILNNT